MRIQYITVQNERKKEQKPKGIKKICFSFLLFLWDI